MTARVTGDVSNRNNSRYIRFRYRKRDSKCKKDVAVEGVVLVKERRKRRKKASRRQKEGKWVKGQIPAKGEEMPPQSLPFSQGAVRLDPTKRGVRSKKGWNIA